MGEVYSAAHVETGQLAAAKLMNQQALEDPRHVARFLREARAIASLDSPHVVRILEACDPTDIVPYFIMERLHGCDLAQHLRSARLTISGLDKLTREVGSVLDAAREQGIVHRDLKPQNLFLADRASGEPIWKVLDFGVATLSEHSGTLTQGHVVGTPSYMAPEQACGEQADYRADLYALAAIAYRWLTRRPAFTGKDIPSLLYQVVHTMPPRPSALADLPPDVDAVLAIGLAKDRDRRFDNARELAAALAAASAGSLDPTLRRRGNELQSEHAWS
jgi:serine/threonine-protein kinase